MTDRDAWKYASFGGSPVYNEDGSLTKCHPDYGSKAAEIRHRTYIAKCTLGRISYWKFEDDIHMAIDEWYITEEPKGLELHEWLGMDIFEYAAWVEKRSTVTDIVKERRSRIQS